jgi:hypothetical protein
LFFYVYFELKTFKSSRELIGPTRFETCALGAKIIDIKTAAIFVYPLKYFFALPKKVDKET